MYAKNIKWNSVRFKIRLDIFIGNCQCLMNNDKNSILHFVQYFFHFWLIRKDNNIEKWLTLISLQICKKKKDIIYNGVKYFEIIKYSIYRLYIDHPSNKWYAYKSNNYY